MNDEIPSAMVEPATEGGPPSSHLVSLHQDELCANRLKRRKDLFGDCALVEIIHLHDCLRGAIKALQRDVEQLCKSATLKDGEDLSEVERRLVGRFKVIWSVFRAHSTAEDEFIWPALKEKISRKSSSDSEDATAEAFHDHAHHHHHSHNHVDVHDPHQVIVQEEYEEDHADEERMFSKMDEMLSKIRSELLRCNDQEPPSSSTARPTVEENDAAVCEMTADLQNLVSRLSKHLFSHLEKEEAQCLPLVAKHMNKEEIHELVGKIMGRRSSDMMGKILTMAVQTLPISEREEMVHYMKQAMVGTFFERWLVMEGFGCSSPDSTTPIDSENANPHALSCSTSNAAVGDHDHDEQKQPACLVSCKDEGHSCVASSICLATGKCLLDNETVTQEEMEKLIKTIAANPSMTSEQKNATIQRLRDSVWKNNRKRKHMETCLCLDVAGETLQQTSSTKDRRVTPPSAYYRKNKEGKVELVWSSDSSTKFPLDGSVPLFSASELAPTYHDGAAGAVLGCPHYARTCKKRHPASGRLYTCRLCCEQDRERPMKDHDSPLDRYKVNEVLCMRCCTLQPSDKQCCNPKCESKGRPFARYYCKICNLYDDSAHKKIYHCPFCNVCRAGAGLGIDYRHCMRCNACVSLADGDHVCIPQRLQGNCPICHESMFESTKPLRGLKCGHVMHLSCFTMYMRGQTYTCPLCKKSVEDMREYFSLLDAAIWMQPMPAAYARTMSNIYCQDCGKSCVVKYHFVGGKCTHCGSYNTRELERMVGSS